MMRLRGLKCLLIIGFCVPVGGCADGPFAELAGLNPYYRNEWERDAQFGPNFHDQLAELRAIRANPQAFDAAEREQVVQLLATIVRDSPNAVLRTEAALTLGSCPSAETTSALQAALQDKEPDVRAAACRAWGKVGGAEALSALAQVLETDAELDVRLVAAVELGGFQDQAAIQALAIALNDDDPALQYRAVQSLKSASGRDFGDSVPAWRDFVEGRTPTAFEPTIAERILRFRWF